MSRSRRLVIPAASSRYLPSRQRRQLAIASTTLGKLPLNLNAAMSFPSLPLFCQATLVLLPNIDLPLFICSSTRLPPFLMTAVVSHFHFEHLAFCLVPFPKTCLDQSKPTGKKLNHQHRRTKSERLTVLVCGHAGSLSWTSADRMSSFVIETSHGLTFRRSRSTVTMALFRGRGVISTR